MLLFSQRMKLAHFFNKWAEQNKVASNPLGVISFLYLKNMLNEERVLEVLKKEERHEKNV